MLPRSHATGRAKQVAGAQRQDVVGRDAGEHEGQETSARHGGRAAQAPPAQRLRDVNELHHEGRDRELGKIGVAERGRHCAEVGTP